jgi:branched-chain amino acid transport system ATP-binding protein
MIELSVQGLRAGYGAVEVLHGVDLAVPRGALTALLGPNGAGKTTLLSVVGGLHPLRAGRVVWGDVDISRTAPDARARGGMTLIPERRGIFPDLTVRENLEVFVGEDGDSDAALASFPVLADRMTQRAGSLSGGEQQMLAIGRGLMTCPRLILFDEPSLGLSPFFVKFVLGAIGGLKRKGIASLLVEQNMRAALRIADRAYGMRTGEVVRNGTAAEIAAAPDIQEAYLGA